MISVYSIKLQFFTGANTIITIISYHGDNNMTNKHLKVHIFANSDYDLLKSYFMINNILQGKYF